MIDVALAALAGSKCAYSGTASQSLKRGGEKNTKSINVLRDLSAVNIFSYYWRCKSSDLISFAVEQTAVTAGHLKLSRGPHFLLLKNLKCITQMFQYGTGRFI